MPNAKSFLYIYIKYIGFDVVWFYGISIIVEHLILSTFYTYIKYMIPKHILKITFLNKPDLIFWLTVKCFHVISNNSD